MKHFVWVLLFAITGCITVPELTRSWPPPEEWPVIYARARTIALASGLVRELDRAVIESSVPMVHFHVMSNIHDVSYVITWRVSECEILTIHGRGDMFTLDRARVERLPNKALPATAAAPGS
jgi:hypothetical protein